MLGNKSDMANERVIPLDEGKKLADTLGTTLFHIEYIRTETISLMIMISILLLVYILFLCLGLEFFETSAKDNINVKIVFER